MIQNILAVLAGNIGWTLLWLSCNAALRSAGLLPAAANRQVETATPLLILIIASVLFSIAAGFVSSALAASTSYWPAIVSCAIQLTLGILFQTQAWKLMPVWYHLSFLSLVVPMTLFGAWLRLK
jgi:hypothetical protein